MPQRIAFTELKERIGTTKIVSPTDPLPVDSVLSTALSKDIDSIDVAKQSAGGVTTTHDAITASVAIASCNEINCRGFNSVHIQITLSGAFSWTFAVYGSLTSGGVYGAVYANYGGTMTAMSITQNTADTRVYSFTGIPDYIKIVPTEGADGAAATVIVQPYNA